MAELNDMMHDVLDWIRPHIPDAGRDPMETSIKLSEEASELSHAIYSGNTESVGEECADVMILLLDIIYLCDVDIQMEFMVKMEKNRKRVWRKEKGALKHENADQ